MFILADVVIFQGGLGGFLIRLLVNALIIMGAAYLLKGVEVKDFSRAVILAVLLAVLNSTIGAILSFITAPINWITLGLFSLIVDAAVIRIADYFMKGFNTRSFGWALLLALVLAVANALLAI